MAKPVKFAGGPYDGYAQPVRHAPETIALPVSAGMFARYVEGHAAEVGEITSIAVYLLDGDIYRFAGAEPPCGRIFTQ